METTLLVLDPMLTVIHRTFQKQLPLEQTLKQWCLDNKYWFGSFEECIAEALDLYFTLMLRAAEDGYQVAYTDNAEEVFEIVNSSDTGKKVNIVMELYISECADPFDVSPLVGIRTVAKLIDIGLQPIILTGCESTETLVNLYKNVARVIVYNKRFNEAEIVLYRLESNINR